MAMKAPNYEQIQSFNNVKDQLQATAVDEFTESLYDGITYDEVLEEAVRIAEKYAMLGAELGAQWYDLCSELAGLDVDPALVDETDTDALEAKAQAAFEKSQQPTVQGVFNDYLQNVINESIRATGDANLWRDYERGLAGGRWCRVPVGETCAWCLMLASQGAWYLTEKSALGGEAGHYHNGCNCIAVYHADASSIEGYTELSKYKNMYYDADNMRLANNQGRENYPQELTDRVNAAKARHKLLEEKKQLEAEERGETYKQKPWTVYNEDMIVMRYKYGLK